MNSNRNKTSKMATTRKYMYLPICLIFTGLVLGLSCKGQLLNSEEDSDKIRADLSALNPIPEYIEKYFGEEYEFVLMWGETGSGPGQFNMAGEIDIDSEGNVYVQDKNNYRIQKFNSEGEYILEWGEHGNEDGQFLWLSGICVDNENNIFISDRDPYDSDPCKIQKFDPEGNYLLKFGKYGEGVGEFHNPAAMDVDNENDLYICDKFNKRIQKYDFEAGSVTIWADSTIFDPEGGPDDISFLPFSFNFTYILWWHIYKTSLDGYPLFDWGEFSPAGISSDKEGNVYVSDRLYIPAVKKYNQNGHLLTQWGYQGSDPGEFFAPAGIAIDDSGYVYVGDWVLNRVQKFRKKQTNIQATSLGKIKASFKN